MIGGQAQFEAWFEGMQHVAERCGHRLRDHERGLMEAAWEASRQQLEVKLPFLYPFYKQEVTEALTAAGVRVQP